MQGGSCAIASARRRVAAVACRWRAGAVSPASADGRASTFAPICSGWAAPTRRARSSAWPTPPSAALRGRRDWTPTDKAAMTTFEPLVNAGSALVGRATLRSPAFTVAGSDLGCGDARRSTARRRSTRSSTPAAARRVDRLARRRAPTGATPVELLTDELDDAPTRLGDADGAARRRRSSTPGGSYRLATRRDVHDADRAGAQGATAVAIDNVALTRRLPPARGAAGRPTATTARTATRAPPAPRATAGATADRATGATGRPARRAPVRAHGRARAPGTPALPARPARPRRSCRAARRRRA